MIDELDKGLNEIESLPVAPVAPLPSEKPKKLIDTPRDVISNIDCYLKVVIHKKTDHRKVDIKKVIENAQCMFRDGARYHDNLWMHHCAASVRELITFLVPDDFHIALSCIPQSNDSAMEEFSMFFINAKAYLSDLVHFCDSARLGNADKLYPNQGYGQKNLEEFLNDETVFFEKVCIDLIYALDEIFSRYCTGAIDESN